MARRMHLKPSNIFYSQHQISATFGKWNRHRHTTIGETLDDLCNGYCKISDIETIKVVKKDGKWCTINNRRLWVFHHLEAAGKCTEIPVEVVDYCPLSHSRKFSSANGGKSVTFIRGKSPGGSWHTRLKPVTPNEESLPKEYISKTTESVSKTVAKEQSSSGKDNQRSTSSINEVLHTIDAIQTNGTVCQKHNIGISEQCQVNGVAVVGITFDQSASASTDKSTDISDVTFVSNNSIGVNSDDFTNRMRHSWSGKPLRLLNGVEKCIRLLDSLKHKLMRTERGSQKRYKPYTYNLTTRYKTRQRSFTQLCGKLIEANLIEEENKGTESSEYILSNYNSSSSNGPETNDGPDDEIMDTGEKNESKKIDYDNDPWSDVDSTYKNGWSDDYSAMLTKICDQMSDSGDNNGSDERDND